MAKSKGPESGGWILGDEFAALVVLKKVGKAIKLRVVPFSGRCIAWQETGGVNECILELTIKLDKKNVISDSER